MLVLGHKEFDPRIIGCQFEFNSTVRIRFDFIYLVSLFYIFSVENADDIIETHIRKNTYYWMNMWKGKNKNIQTFSIDDIRDQQHK